MVTALTDPNVEVSVAKKTEKQKKAADRQMEAEIRQAMNQPWIQMKTALVVITITSLAMAGFTAWQYWYSLVWWKAIGLGLIFGAAIWGIFFGMMWINRTIRR